MDDLKIILTKLKILGLYKPEDKNLFNKYLELKDSIINFIQEKFNQMIQVKEVYQHLTAYKVYHECLGEIGDDYYDYTEAYTGRYYSLEEATQELEKIIEKEKPFEKDWHELYYVSKSSELLIKLKEYTITIDEENFIFHKPIEGHLLYYYFDKEIVKDNTISVEKFRELAEKATIRTKKEYEIISNQEYQDKLNELIKLFRSLK